MMKIQLQKSLHTASGKMSLEVEMDILKGAFVTIQGPSGAGKTSILKMIAGILQPDQGRIRVADTTWLDTKRKINMPPQKRGIGYVFQEYALFPNMTVLKNLMYGLGKNQDSRIVNELIEMMQLGDLQQQYPQQLSGGQQQRVALARALVRKPEILVLDEPLAALDYDMRNRAQQYILQLHKEYELITIMVSHDTSEIIKMSDTVYRLDYGNIREFGDPKTLLARVSSPEALTLEGEVISLELKNQVRYVGILVGNNIIQTSFEATNQRNEIKIGDRVEIATNGDSPLRVSKKQG